MSEARTPPGRPTRRWRARLAVARGGAQWSPSASPAHTATDTPATGGHHDCNTMNRLRRTAVPLQRPAAQLNGGRGVQPPAGPALHGTETEGRATPRLMAWDGMGPAMMTLGLRPSLRTAATRGRIV